MTIHGKIWGNTECLLLTPMIEIHRIFITPNMQCSTHKHEHKWNGFYCLGGGCNIVVQKNDYALTDITYLSSGMFTAVKPGEYHRFETGNYATQLLEIYWIDGISEDIVRQNCGGVIDQLTVNGNRFHDNE